MNASAEADLLFDWGNPQRRTRTIILFIGASLLLHALSFYVFQIVYPPTVVLLPPPARVNFVANNSEENRALLRWMDAEDPALATATQRPPGTRSHALPKLEHIPSYLSERAPLKEAPPLVVDLRPPSAQPPGPVPISRAEIPSAPNSAPTGVALSEEIPPLGAPQFPVAKFTASNNEEPENVRFRIAINQRGEVQYCFPINSSGDAALNEQARRHVALARFPARSTSPNESLIWGIATVEWGSDVAFPPARSTSTPPP